MIFVNYMQCFEIWRAVACNNLAKHHLMLHFSQYLKLSRQWCFKIWSRSESNILILCPFATRSVFFVFCFDLFVFCLLLLSCSLPPLQKRMKETRPTQCHETLRLVAGRNKFHGIFVSCYVSINSAIKWGVYWPTWTIFCLMFLWPCIMNWLYINYQLDALTIIYS